MPIKNATDKNSFLTEHPTQCMLYNTQKCI